LGSGLFVDARGFRADGHNKVWDHDKTTWTEQGRTDKCDANMFRQCARLESFIQSMVRSSRKNVVLRG
jgi:hypothetical protein